MLSAFLMNLAASDGTHGEMPSSPSEAWAVSQCAGRTGLELPAASADTHPVRPANDPAPPTRHTRALNIVAITTAVLGVTAVLSVAQRASAVAAGQFGLTLAASTAAATGIVVGSLASARRLRGSTVEGPRILLALAVVTWSIGELLIARRLGAFDTLGTPSALPASPTAGPQHRPFGVGDSIAMLAAPLALLALLQMPRHSRSPWPGLRLALDTVLLAVTSTLMVWCTAIEPHISTPHDRWPAIAVTFGDLVTVSVSVLVRLREARQGVMILVVGSTLQAAADISSLPPVIDNKPFPWMSGALWCIAWPIIGLGLERCWTAPVTDEQVSLVEDFGESKVSTTTTVVTFFLAVAMLISGDHLNTPQTSALGAMVLAIFSIREILGNRLRVRLVTDLAAAALCDTLTGLPNRQALVHHLRSLPADRDRILLTIDLDRFKNINDLLGTEAGDTTIVNVAHLLSRTCPPDAFVARLGGDEFAVLLPRTVDDGVEIGRQLVATVGTTFADQHLGVGLTASMGVGRVTNDRATAFLESAAALQAAKVHGGGHVRAYPGEVERTRERRQLVERRLGEALAADMLEMHAQPLVELTNGAVHGFESLARWTDDVLGVVSPAEFAPVAEDSGLVAPLGEFALRRSLEEAVRTGAIARSLKVGVNVSPLQLRAPYFARLVGDLVAELEIPPQLVMLEVTEAILVDEDVSATTLARLADIGIRLAIDDFGTGYSALGYLRRLPVDHLKFDRSWVVTAATDARTRQIMSSVVEMSHSLGALVVMEGIEDEDTAAVCRELGADLGQGWLFGRAKPWDVAVVDAVSTHPSNRTFCSPDCWFPFEKHPHVADQRSTHFKLGGNGQRIL
jgi:diguanylate cyclase (GGDEF)-like protein